MKQIATVDKILTLSHAFDSDYQNYWICTFLCDDGKMRTIGIGEGDNITLENEGVIKQGYQFEYESELSLQLCQPDYKAVYETIDKFLIESEDVLLGNIMETLQGRINPEVARNIIRQRLLIDKAEK